LSRKGRRTLADLLVGCDRVVVLHDPDLTSAELACLGSPQAATTHDLAEASPERAGIDAVVLAAADLSALRRCVSAVDRELTARVVGVAVLRAAPTPVLVPHPSLPPLAALDVQAGSPALAVATFEEEAPVARVLAGFARSVATGVPATTGWPATGALRSEPHRWPVADPGATVDDAERVLDLSVDFPPALVVADADASADSGSEHRTTGRPPVTVGVGPEPAWAEYGDHLLPRLREHGPLALGPLDERLLNPVGFKRQHRRPVARLVAHEQPERLALHTAQGTTELDARHGPSEQDVDGLRRLAAVHLGWDGAHGPHAYARFVAGLAMAGVPLVSHQVPGWAAALLHPTLVAALGTAPVDHDDIVEREVYSIRMRRAALAHHGQAGWRRDAGTAHGLQTTPQPRVSVLLPTRRPEQVEFALRQVGRQRGVALEMILVTHGFAADPAVLAAFRAACEVPLTALEASADLPFGAALNLAARAATGDLLLKMDDDDWYGRDFVADLLLARLYSGAEVVGVPPEFTFIEPLWLTVRRQDATEAYRPVVAGGTMLIDRATFVAVGGFRETRRFVDAGLLAAVLDGGGAVYRSHGHGYLLRRGVQGHTWDPGLGYFVGRKLSWHQWRGFRPSPLLDADDVDVPVHPGGGSRA
jgi:Glycosyl transferase family 2